MKKGLLFITAIIVFAVGAKAQEFEVKKSSGFKFDVDAGATTGENIIVDGKTFEMFETTSGSRYVKAVSKTGNLYPVWIGTDTGKFFESRKVYKSKSGSYCVFKLTKSGYPHATWLNAK